MEEPLDSISSTSSSNNCTICFTEISEEEKITLNCNHFFCNTCIQDWLDKNKYSCPLCRSDIKEYNVNDKNYRIVLKDNNNNQINTEINELNRYLIRINSRFRYLFYVSVIFSTYFLNLYIGNLNNYSILQEKYNECNTNLTSITIQST